MNKFLKMILTEPTLFTSALRMTFLAVAAFAVALKPEQIGAILLAVEGWLALANRSAVTPTIAAEKQAVVAADQRETEINAYLKGVETPNPK